MNILKNPMVQIQKNLEINRVRKQKRQDIRDLRMAGVYSNGVNAYLDSDGYPLDGVEIPVWFKNLSKAWAANRKNGARSKDTIPKSWDEWCDERVDLIGIDPRKAKRPVGRPRLPAHLKKNPTKAKRSDRMRALLLEHGVNIKSVGRDEFLIEHPGWEFLPNGRLRYQENQPISVHRFLQDHNLIPM